MFYNCNKITFTHGGPYKESPDWIKTKKWKNKPKNGNINFFNMKEQLR